MSEELHLIVECLSCRAIWENDMEPCACRCEPESEWVIRTVAFSDSIPWGPDHPDYDEMGQ